MSFIKEFREFAMRGNVADLAIGVIIGSAFGKVVSSLVADIIMPPIGLLIGGVDLKQFSFVLREARNDVPAVIMNYGSFLQSLVDCIIVTLAIFSVIKFMNKLRRELEGILESRAEINKEKTEVDTQVEPPAPQEILLMEIRDLLKKSTKK
ncbi:MULTISPECIES: large-conductance mechanosensitive channel protein MscL [Candidatus Williamhamiltonella]|uniref:Large-conductance mechanosensitive channel n=1 Tax=Candidatus Williamhamiltonella defendens TaxID=138072 RepID=A0A2D3TBT9_9ENTR|nr:large-conductance mechanosensitive channel protein MscL [Candidatus Hamiltonella defensa]ATW33249.1 large-conductance mechanosensitive channel [Candidatus Hamiltonella defensa]